MNNSSSDPEWVNYVVFTVLGMTLLVSGAIFSGLFDAILSGNYQLAEVLSSILSVLATIALVAVTWLYVGFTSDLVNQAEKQRQQERELEISRHQTRRQNLRQAFLIELAKISGTLNKLAESEEKDRLSPNRYSDVLMPTVVYESNVDQIGILPTEEAADLTSIYTNVLHIRSVLETYNQIDDKEELDEEDELRKEVIEDTVPLEASKILNEIGDFAEIMAEEAEGTMTIERLSKELKE